MSKLSIVVSKIYTIVISIFKRELLKADCVYAERTVFACSFIALRENKMASVTAKWRRSLHTKKIQHTEECQRVTLGCLRTGCVYNRTYIHMCVI
jgi:hypothetical protein